jgi:TfoX/Sxy family transcriptional regulator of competence genes
VSVSDVFERVSERLLAEDPELGQGRMMNATGLKKGGKFFAMVVKDELVVKLPAARVDELIAEGSGNRFDPGHGRLMKEWVTLRPADESACEAYVVEAREFVSSARSGAPKG